MTIKELKFRGTTYKNLDTLAKEYGIKYSTLTYRLREGYTLEEAIEWGKTKYTVTAFGKTYESIANLAEEYNIDAGVLSSRMNTGLTLEEAIEWGESFYSVTAFGKTHKNTIELTNYYGIDASKLEGKIRVGKSIEEAITEILNTEPIIYVGREYPSMSTLCNNYAINASTVRKRILRGWSLADSLEKPVAKNKPINSYTYRGVTYDTQRELVEAHGMSLNLVYYLGKRLNIEFIQALDILVVFLVGYKGNRPMKISKIPYIIYNGEWSDTLKSLLSSVGVPRAILKDYMRRNGITSHIEALTRMSTDTTVRWVDTETNTLTTKDGLVKKYRSSMQTLEKTGVAKKATVRAYPDCTFNPTGYCATPERDFELYLSKNYLHLTKKD